MPTPLTPLNTIEHLPSIELFYSLVTYIRSKFSFYYSNTVNATHRICLRNCDIMSITQDI